MRHPVTVRLDFVAPTGRSPRAAALLFAGGLAASIALAVSFKGALDQRAALDAKLGALAPAPVTPPSPQALKAAADEAIVERELSIPWTQLLADLEAASQDSAATVSVLEVQPDPAKHVVRITAEARTLPDALKYLERLQQTKVLRYPMLESHELRKDDPDHPVRVKLAAEWPS